MVFHKRTLYKIFLNQKISLFLFHMTINISAILKTNTQAFSHDATKILPKYSSSILAGEKALFILMVLFDFLCDFTLNLLVE